MSARCEACGTYIDGRSISLTRRQVNACDVLARRGYGSGYNDVAKYLLQRAFDDLVRANVLASADFESSEHQPRPAGEREDGDG